MVSGCDEGTVLVTGACGHIGSWVCNTLRDARHTILRVDLEPGAAQDVIACDLRVKNDLARLFEGHRIRAVIHLAGILPSAFQTDPLAGAEVNLSGSLELMGQAVAAGVKRFVFASSLSVYGSCPGSRLLTEDDPAVPDEPYGASKRAIELIGESLAKNRAFEFVSLRIARVVGQGIKKTSSQWRSQVFGPLLQSEPIRIPFSPEATLSLVHVEDVARILIMLVERSAIKRFVYNTPAEIWRARQLKKVVEELKGVHVELAQGGSDGGPVCDGSRLAREFGFQLRGLRDRLSDGTTSN